MAKSHIKQQIALLYALGLGLFLFSACTQSQTPTRSASPAASPISSPQVQGSGGAGCTLKVVSIFPLQGIFAVETASMVNTIQLALQEHGMTTHDSKCSIVYNSLDDSTAAQQNWDPAVVAAVANQVANDPEVLAVVGPINSREAKLAVPIFNRAGGLVMVTPSPASSYWVLTKAITPSESEIPAQYYPTGIRNFARVVATADTDAAVSARWYKAQGLTSVYLVHDDDPYSLGTVKVFKAEALKLGLTITANDLINSSTTAYSNLVGKIAASGADSVYFAVVATEATAPALKQLRATNWRGQIGGYPDFLYDEIVALAGTAAEGAFTVQRGVPLDTLVKTSPAAAKWFAAYQLKFGKPPEIYDPYAYEAMNVILAALDHCSAAETYTRECVRAAVFNTKNWNGVLGDTWSFDANGDTTLTLESAERVKKGKLEFIGVVK